MYQIFLAFITAFLITFFAIPSIIKIARKRHFVDEPDERRAHIISTPSLGGIGIFAGTLFSIILWTPLSNFGQLQYILGAFIIIFLVGARDDIDPIDAWKKLLGQILAALVLILYADIRLTSLYNILGIGELPFTASLILTLFIIVLVVNAFNLIDGINGLSGSIGSLVALTFGVWFIFVNRFDMTTIAFALSGSTMAFLYYNITPARIFMGDTGSLFIGLTASILAIEFIQAHQDLSGTSPFFKAPPAMAAGILIIPLYDTLRVSITRLVRGRSLFGADRNHIHHLLLNTGLSHMQATAVLLITNILFILVAYIFQGLGTLPVLAILLGLAIMLTLVLYYLQVSGPTFKFDKP